jgi:hypothetical protein
MPLNNPPENKSQPEASTSQELQNNDFENASPFSFFTQDFGFAERFKLKPTAIQPKDIQRLQQTIGNKAVQRLLAVRKEFTHQSNSSPFSKRNSIVPSVHHSIQRRIEDKYLGAAKDSSVAAMDQKDLPVDLTVLMKNIEDYATLDHTKVPDDASREIMCVETIFSEASRLGEQAQKFRGSKGIERSETTWPLLGWELACEELAKQARLEKEKLEPLTRGLIESGTAKALEGGSAKYLLVSPTDHSSTGSESGYGATIPPEERYTLGVSGPKSGAPGLGVNVKIKPSNLEILVFAGGHGGVEGFFWSEAVGAWWTKNVVEPMVSKGIKAKIIILDACLSASKVEIFAPLLLGGGKIISYLHSISEMTMTPQVWSGVYSEVQKGSPETIPELLTGQINGKRQLGGDSFKYSSVALYDQTTKNLTYDPGAMSSEALKQVNNDPTFKSEMFGQSKKLKETEEGGSYNVRHMKEYGPSLTSDKEKGTFVPKDASFEVDWMPNAFMDAGVIDTIDDYGDIKKDGVYFEVSASRYLYIVDKEDVPGTKLTCRIATDKEVQEASALLI